MLVTRQSSRWLFTFLTLLLLLAACGSDSSEPEDDRSFAPEAQGDVALPTDTPAPTSTFEPIDIQPGEDSSSNGDLDTLLAQTGPTTSMLSGLTDYLSVSVDSGKATAILDQRTSAISVSLSPDGQHALVIDRTSASPNLRLLDADGKEVAEWTAEPGGSPVASPVPDSGESRVADRVAWNGDSSRIAVWLTGVGLLLADNDLAVQRLNHPEIASITALAFSPSGQSLAAGVWNSESQSAAILSMTVATPDGTPGTLMQTAEGDGRFIRSMAWGNEQVGILFALRDAGSSNSLPNDLYMVPRFGEPMRLVASAGVAAPAALIDEIALAGDGQTVAYTILVPGESGYRLHSLWVTDALTPRALRLDMVELRRINEIAWSTSGLVVSGYIRGNENDSGYVSTVLELYLPGETRQILTEKSAATPVASPEAEPAEASPEPED